MKKETTLYNVVFPIWLMVLFPTAWIAVIPLNLIVDFLVMFITLKVLKSQNAKLCIKSSLLPVWLFGFLSDFIGVGILFSTYLIGLIPALSESDAYTDILGALTMNPFENIWALLWTLAAIAVAGVMIYIFNRFISFRKLPLENKQKHLLALSMAVFTAPYLFLLPTKLFY